MKLSNHIRRNVAGYAAIFLVLTGTAVALPGRATVQSNDLKPNVVRAKHIKDGQVGDAEIASGGLTGGAIADDSLGGHQVAEGSLFNDNSLTGDDINEATLAGVLRFGGSIPSGTTITGVVGCASNDNSPGVDAVCREAVTFPLPAPAPVTKADFAPGGVGEDEPSCTGNTGLPTAPPGQVCVYDLGSLAESAGAAPFGRHGFVVDAQGPTQAHILALWAYRAP